MRARGRCPKLVGFITTPSRRPLFMLLRRAIAGGRLAAGATGGSALAAALLQQPAPSRCANAAAASGSPLPTSIGDVSALQMQMAGVSGLTGYTAGFAAKRAFRVFVFTAGCVVAGLQTLAYHKLITVHWDLIEERLNSCLDLNADGTVNQRDLLLGNEKLQAYLAAGLPSAGGFSAGFLLGLRS